jgi:hypothetical protein
MTKERFDQFAGTAERIAKIEDQQELSDKAQHKEYERRLLDKDFVESLNPLAQENLKMRDEITRLTREISAAKGLCKIYFDIASESIGEAEVRKKRDFRIDILKLCNCIDCQENRTHP